MNCATRLPYHKTVAVLTTMHAKERVIAPILRAELGLIVGLAMGVNTHQFGSFSREIERAGTPLDAARAKIAAGFDYAPLARVGLASEGSFGPHPYLPFLALGRELVMLIDRDSGLEVMGWDASSHTNYSQTIVSDLEEARAFAKRVNFPEHGLIVMGHRSGQPAPDLMLDEEVTEPIRLESAVQAAIALCGRAFVEADMRAHRNPTRMAAIERATRDLARRFLSCCPRCGHRG